VKNLRERRHDYNIVNTSADIIHNDVQFVIFANINDCVSII